MVTCRAGYSCMPSPVRTRISTLWFSLRFLPNARHRPVDPKCLPITSCFVVLFRYAETTFSKSEKPE